MIYRIDVQTAHSSRSGEAAIDPVGEALRHQIQEFGKTVGRIHTARVFLIEADADASQIEQAAAALLADPLVESAIAVKSAAKDEGKSRIEIHLKAGVMDPVAASTEMALRDMGVKVREVRTGRAYLIDGNIPREELQFIASRVLANGVIESVHFDTFLPAKFETGRDYQFRLKHVGLRNLNDAELQKLSREGHLFLSLAEMQAIQTYFRERDREPTDIELETLAQTWSEHCVHKTLKSAVDVEVRDADGKVVGTRRYKNLIKETIFDSTMELMGKGGSEGRGSEGRGDAETRRRGDGPDATSDHSISPSTHPGVSASSPSSPRDSLPASPRLPVSASSSPASAFCLSVFKDNAGVIAFDETHAVCFKVETHNHPSAIEPYGGSATGAGGVIRDILGTGLAAKPIANTDVFCVAFPDFGREPTPPEQNNTHASSSASSSSPLPASPRPSVAASSSSSSPLSASPRPGVSASSSSPALLSASPRPGVSASSSSPLPKGIIHPKRILQQVVAGVRDYGNRMGIPTVNGAVYFDDRYLGNPLVFCGCVGLIPRDKIEKETGVGDCIVVMGGRTGRDGIHGATFSSAELTDTHADEFSHAVQIGNAITEKKVADVILQARDRDLFTAVTDCGAGGLSSAVGEMGDKIGAAVELDKVPLKYAGLRYDEIWISEAQERMVLSVPKQKLDELLALAASEDVEANVIGTFGTPNRELILSYLGTEVGRMAMEFIHHGIPTPTRRAVVTERWVERRGADGRGDAETQGRGAEGHGVEGHGDAETRGRGAEGHGVEGHGDAETRGRGDGGQTPSAETSSAPSSPSSPPPISASPRPGVSASSPPVTIQDRLLALLSHPNIASKHWIIRQYDHEVQGGSVVKPLIGPRQMGPSDASVLRPKLNSYRGVVVGCGLSPQVLDPYDMALAAIDEAVRNVVAVGADPGKVAILDNFCWPSVDDEKTMGTLVRACEACRDAALAYRIPFISGKDSLHNQFTDSETGRVIRIPNTLLISAIGVIDDVRKCITMDLKDPREGRLLLISPASDSLEDRIATHRALAGVIQRELVLSCHDVSEGGYLTTVAEMCIASGLGADVATDAANTFFAENVGQYVVETTALAQLELEKRLGLTGVKIREIGKTLADARLEIGELLPNYSKKIEAHLSIDDMTRAWRGTLDW